MATSDILGLFMSPEQYQAQQMAQQQAAEQQRAFNFAQLSPRDQAVYGMFLGGQQLARGLGGLLGVQDPQLQRIRQRQEIMQSINPADMQSLMAGIQLASERGDQELALSLTDFMNKQGSEMALAQQRQAQATRERVQSTPSQIAISREIGILQTNLDELKKTPETPERNRGIAILQSQLDNLIKQGPAGIQEAARIGEIERKQAEMRAANADAVNSDEYKALDAEKMRLQRAARATGATDDEKKATAYANSVSDDPNSKEWKDAFSSAFNRLIFGKDGSDKFTQLTNLYAQRKKAVATSGVDSEDVKIIDRIINSIAPEKGDKTFESLAKAERIGVLTDELNALEVDGKKNTPEYRRKAVELKSLQGDRAGTPIKEVVLAEEIAKLDAFIRDAKDPTAPDVVDAKTKAQLYRDAMKRERPNIDTLGLAKGGKYDGQPVFLDETSRKTFVFDTDKEGKQIEVPYTGGLKGLKGGTEVNVGGSKVVVDTGEVGKAAGKELGKELITVKDKQSALDSIQDALSMLNQGIYAGPYSQLRKGAAKYLGVGSSDKVARTEEFMSYIGDVVVARLKDFGGNDSEQELAYLNRIIGGDLEVEPKALKRILERADAKIRRGIERLRRQAVSGEKKESLTTTLPEADAAQAPPKPTRRFNKATGKLEVVQ